MAEARAIEADDAKFFCCRIHQPADRKILKKSSIAVEHHQRGRVCLAAIDVMQTHALDLEELANRRVAPARDELQRDVRQYDGEQHQE